MSLPLTKTKLVNLYKKENDPKVKERLLLVIRVREDKQIPFYVVKEMHRSNPWASDWLKRYDKEGIKGLQDRTKSGRPPELSEETSCQIKKELKESNQKGGPQQTSGRGNRKEKWYKISLHSHLPHPSQMEIQTEGAKKGTC
jgi:transposase